MEMTCPKCQATSGNDWSQCLGACPIPGSPHHFIDLTVEHRTEDEWVGECVDILTTEPFHWSEGNARSYAAGLFSFFGVLVEPEAAIDEDRQYWEPAP